LDLSKRTLRACTRLRELEARNRNRDAYESACSITITWPYKIPAKERSATLLSILKHQGYPTWHLDSMGHTDLDNRPTNRTIIRMSSKEVAEDLRWAINKNYYTPLNQWGEHTEGGGRRGNKGYLKAEPTPYTRDRFETTFKMAVINALPRLAMCNGSDLYVDSTYADGAVVNAAGELLLWVAVTHQDDDSFMEVYTTDSIHDRIKQQIERIVKELLHDADEPLENGADLNSIYMDHESEINEAQTTATDYVKFYNDCTDEARAAKEDEHRTNASMFTHLSEQTKEDILLAMDELKILATYERKEHRQPWELSLPRRWRTPHEKGRERRRDSYPRPCDAPSHTWLLAISAD